MKDQYFRDSPGCPVTLRRRNFLTAMGVSAAAVNTDLFGLASSLFASPTKRSRRPRIGCIFVRPEQEEYWMGWPGAVYDCKARQADYYQTLADAAEQFEVQLELDPKAVEEPEEVENVLQRMKESSPDGLIVTIMNVKDWPQVEYIAKNRGDIPLVIYSPLGTSFIKNLAAFREIPRTFVAATPELSGLTFAVRVLDALWEMRHTRICMFSDVHQGDEPLDPLGPVLHYLPLSRWPKEVAKVGMSEEMHEIAKYYVVEAKEVLEPEEEDLLEAVRNYVAARRIMEAENCQAISVDCARLLNEHSVTCGPCLAWSRLLDEGIVGACEADWRAALSLELVSLLSGRPGFMQDPAPNTINNTVIASHCTCATKLAGFDQPHEPFLLHNHAESASGVSLRVMWPEDQEITIVKFQSPTSLLLGTGRVLRNVDTSRGGCRTAVEVEVDGTEHPCDVCGHHQVLAYGNLKGPIEAFCRLAGIEVQPVWHGAAT